MKTYLIPAIALLALSACNHKPESNLITQAVVLAPPPKAKMVRFPPPVVKPDNAVESNADENADAAADETVNTVVKDTSKKIVKQGDISFEAKDIAATRKAMLNALNKSGGYADEDNESVDSGNDRKEYVIKARIPAKNFDAFLDVVSSGAVKIDSKHISVSDVTTQYIDMTTRLHNQKVLEATYLNLLKRASKMKDVLDVEEKLTGTRTEIETEQGQLNYLHKQIAYSSLDITFYTKQVQQVTGNTAGYKLSTAFSEGWQILQAMFFGTISLWPLVLFFTGMFIIIRRWLKRRGPETRLK